MTTTSLRSGFAMRRGMGQIRSESTTTAFWERLLVAVIALVWSTTLVVDFRVALTLLWVTGLAVAGLGLRYPRLGLLGIGMLCSLHGFAAPLLLRGGVWRWNTVNYLLLAVALLFWPYLLRVGKLQSRVLVAFILLLGLEILLSPDPGGGIQHVFSVVAVFGLLVYFRRVALDLEAWYWFAVVTGAMAACGSAAYLLQQDSLPWVNRNAWSYAPLTATFAISLAFVATGGVRRRGFVLALLAATNGLWVFLSASRGSMLTGVVCLAFLLTVMPLRRALLVGSVAGLVCIAILSQFTTLQESAVARLGLLTDRGQAVTIRTSGRSDLALAAWYIFRDHPWGVGTGGFNAHWADPGASAGVSRFERQNPHLSAHSAWTKVLAENGLPGILLLGAYVFSFTVSGWRARTPHSLTLGMMVTAVLGVGWIPNEFWNPGLWLLAAGATVLLERDPSGGVSRPASSIARG